MLGTLIAVYMHRQTDRHRETDRQTLKKLNKDVMQST